MCSFILLIFSSKSFTIFLISILKYLTANSNMWLIIGLLLLMLLLLILSYILLLLPIDPMIVWALALLDWMYFDFAFSLRAALSPKAQSFCSLSAKCEVFYQFPYWARLELKATLCSYWNEISAQFLSSSDATSCLISWGISVYVQFWNLKKDLELPPPWHPTFWDFPPQSAAALVLNSDRCFFISVRMLLSV